MNSMYTILSHLKDFKINKEQEVLLKEIKEIISPKEVSVSKKK